MPSIRIDGHSIGRHFSVAYNFMRRQAEIFYAAFLTQKNFIRFRNMADILKNYCDQHITEVFSNRGLNI